MRDKFKGYSRKTEKEIKKIWEEGIVTFDTNILLNLYRYSKSTQRELLSMFERLENKIWLSHQSCLEYHINRYDVIAEQQKAYDNFKKSIEQMENELRSTNKAPFLSEELHKKLEEVFSEVKKEVTDTSLSFSNMLKNDYVYEKINKLFNKKIGDEFDAKKLDDLFRIGEERFKNKIPPGFEDKDKDGNKKYGDFILWEQIKLKAKETQKPIILITDERKKDWWWKLDDNRTIGPRQELVKEIWDFAKVDFLMYASERFLTFASKYLNQEVSSQALDEIRERKNIERNLSFQRSINNSRLNNFRLSKYDKDEFISVEELENEINLIRLRMKNIEESINRLEYDESVENQSSREMLSRIYNRLRNEHNLLVDRMVELMNSQKESNFEKPVDINKEIEDFLGITDF